MIRRVRANHSSFKAVEFLAGFNVVLADRTDESGSKDSRNGLGKSTLIEIIHFCLGASTQKHKGLVVPNLRDWAFTLDIVLAGSEVSVTREVNRASRVIFEESSDTSSWIIQPRYDPDDNVHVLSIESWRLLLGYFAFGLSVDGNNSPFSPSFRSLIAYFIRKGKEAFINPFEHFSKQPTWDKQISHAFLLGLAWEDARDWQVLREQQEALTSLKKLKTTGESGVVTRVLGSLGELEVLRVRTEQQVRQRKQELSNFQVHPQYRELEQEVNRLTAEIHELTNENIDERRLLTFYQSSLNEENEPSSSDLIRLYESAGVELPGLVIRRLDEVEQFHHQLIQNRRSFLATQVEQLQRSIHNRDQLIRQRTTERATRLDVLRTHGALEEYTKLQELYLESCTSLTDINQRIEELRRIEEEKSALRLAREQLMQRALSDYEDRRSQIERAIGLFNNNVETLYAVPGRLIIDINLNGFQFNAEIDRDRSDGVGNMKIFCYDLMLAQLWSEKICSPNLLIHDSRIFDGVDERQRAAALELVTREATNRGFQYICTMNSDMVPTEAFSSNFNFDTFVRLRLVDVEEGNLLGVDF